MIAFLKATTERHSLDYLTLRLIVGGIAILLAVVVDASAPWSLESISASYFAGEPARSIFVGCLFAIAVFLFSYNGEWRIEFWASKVAAVSAIGIALVPCKCDVEIKKDSIQKLQCLRDDAAYTIEKSLCLNPLQDANGLHWGFAGLLFGVLTVFCLIFYIRAKEKRSTDRGVYAKRRMKIYATCFVFILTSAITLLIDKGFGRIFSDLLNTFVYWAEFVGLVSFGVSWITASHATPGLAHPTLELWGPLKRLRAVSPIPPVRDEISP